MQNTNCPNCGAPLDRTGARNGYVSCEYCGTTVRVSSGEEQLQQFAADFIEDTYRDVHLMIEQPERYIEEFAAAGADGITVHAESTHHLHRVLQQIRARGKRPGVVLNPASPLSALDYVLEDVELVLIMSVNPGFGGQKLIESSYRKVEELRAMCMRRGLDDMLIEVDGGVNAQTAPQLISAGANVLVAGSALFGAEDPVAMVKALKMEQ